MDNTAAAEHVVRTVKAEWPQLPIIARAHDKPHAARLFGLGATEVILEAMEASLQLASRTLQLAGTSEEIIHRRIEAQRRQELESCNHQAAKRQQAKHRPLPG